MAQPLPRQLERILAGGVPDSAEARLAELRAAKRPAFSSFLSVREFAAGEQRGMRPITQVVGAAGCRLAIGVRRTTRPGVGRARLGSRAGSRTTARTAPGPRSAN